MESWFKRNFQHLIVILLAIGVLALGVVWTVSPKRNYSSGSDKTSKKTQAPDLQSSLQSTPAHPVAIGTSAVSREPPEIIGRLSERSLTTEEMDRLIAYGTQAVDALLGKLAELDESGKERSVEVLARMHSQSKDSRIPGALSFMLLQPGTIAFKSKVLDGLTAMDSKETIPALEKVMMHYQKKEEEKPLTQDEAFILQRITEIISHYRDRGR